MTTALIFGACSVDSQPGLLLWLCRAQAGNTDVLTLWAQGEEWQGLWGLSPPRFGLMHLLQGTAPGWTLTFTEFIFQGPHAWALLLINEGTWDKSLSDLSPSHDA